VTDEILSAPFEERTPGRRGSGVRGTLPRNTTTENVMRTFAIRTAVLAPTLALAFVCAPSASDRPHERGDHPAVVVQRLQRDAGYDYASKFYPHPAWMYLYAAPPDDAERLAMTAEPTEDR
jgi:hypothetical protein